MPKSTTDVRERAEPGEHRVQEDGEHEGADPAEPVAHDAEPDAADRPADQEDGGRPGRAGVDVGVELGLDHLLLGRRRLALLGLSSVSLAASSGSRGSSGCTCGTRSRMAGRRATLKSCWSMQSRSHARQATMNTNHWYPLSCAGCPSRCGERGRRRGHRGLGGSVRRFARLTYPRPAGSSPGPRFGSLGARRARRPGSPADVLERVGQVDPQEAGRVGPQRQRRADHALGRELGRRVGERTPGPAPASR